MSRTFRRALRAVALATALAASTPLSAGPALAEDPVTTTVETGEDTVALVNDTVADLQRGCLPIVRSWTPAPLTYTPNIPSGSASTWYRVLGGGTAHLSCSTPVKIVARLSDTSAPPFLPYFGPASPTLVTSANPKDMGQVNVPYVGPDAPVLRPFGMITVHVEVFRKVSTGRYSKIYNGCMEWHYVIVPAAAVTVTDPTTQGACEYDAAYLAADTADGAGVEIVQND